DDAQRLQRSYCRECISAERRAVPVESIDRSERLLANVTARDGCTDRGNRRAERLCQHQNVGNESFRLISKHRPCAAEPGLHLIQNHDRAATTAQILRVAARASFIPFSTASEPLLAKLAISSGGVSSAKAAASSDASTLRPT